jgi:hypothetical protein
MSHPAHALPPEPEPAPDAPATLRGRVKAFRNRHARLEATLFFIGGFGFDAVMVKRIDDLPMLIQQAAYLLLIGLLLAYTLYLEGKELEPPRLLRKVWRFSDHAAHFMLGTLLNAFAIFYLKSASGLTTVLFAAVIASLLAINELPFFHKLGPVVMIGIYAFCTTSFLAYLVPELFGHIRPWMFFLACAGGLLPHLAIGHLQSRWIESRPRALREVVVPALIVQAVLIGLFVLKLIPPVPLALEQIGIYHQVSHTAGTDDYQLVHERPAWWQFWRKDDRAFRSRPGDRVYAFVRVFAPRNFRDKIVVRWLKDDPRRGWVSRDAVPLTVMGGREEGFRGFAFKGHYDPGDWKVQIESEDGRAIGQLPFTVTESADTLARDWVEDHG